MAKKWALDDLEQLHKDAKKALAENLVAGEAVQVIVRGSYDSAVIATDRRVFVFKKGFMSGAAMAKKLASWDYRNITGIQIETGVVSGTVAIQAAGATAGDAGSWTGGKDLARTSTNAIELHRDHFDQARTGVAAIRQLISAHQGPPVAAAVAQAPALDVMDQIRKLGELRDSGLLTAEEFESKKAELLARM